MENLLTIFNFIYSVQCQKDFINPEYLNAREKDSLKDFVKSIS